MAYKGTLKKDGSPLRNKTKEKTPESQGGWERSSSEREKEEERKELRKTDTEKEGGKRGKAAISEIKGKKNRV